MTIDWRAADRWLMGEAMTNTHIPSYIDTLCDDIGVRWGGSTGERKAVDYIVAQRKQHGLARPRVEEFGLNTWECESASITVEGEEARTLDARPCLFCPPVSVTGPLVNVGFGMDHEIEPVRRKLKGAIALMAMGFEPFSPPRLHTARLEELARLGVRCVISPHPEGGRRMSHASANDWRDGSPSVMAVPWVQTSREDGARLARRAAQGKRATVSVKARFKEAKSWNTIAEVPGGRWPDEHIILGSHHDTTPDSPGANDNGSGTSVNLEAGRLLAALREATGVSPGMTLRFVTFGSEEQTLQGSFAYVKRHCPPTPARGKLAQAAGQAQVKGDRPEPKPRFMVNLDELGTGNMKGVALVFPELRSLVQGQLDEMREGLRCHVMAQMDASGDMFPFALAGVPSSMLWRWRFVGRHPDAAFGHASTDTPDKVRVRELKEYAGLLSRLLLRLSHVPPSDWPDNKLDVAAIARRTEAERGSVIRTM